MKLTNIISDNSKVTTNEPNKIKICCYEDNIIQPTIHDEEIIEEMKRATIFYNNLKVSIDRLHEMKMYHNEIHHNQFEMIHDEFMIHRKKIIKYYKIVKTERGRVLRKRYRYCKRLDCITESNFNFPDETKGMYCSVHAEPGMKNVTIVHCKGIDENGIRCEQRAQFNIKGESPMYCETHKTENMCNTRYRLCDVKECQLAGSFGYKDQPKNDPLFCYNHSKDDMKNLRCSQCKEPNCEKSPSYNFKGESAAYCKQHKLSGMIIVRTCIHPECNTSPYFNLPGLSAKYCKEHKSEDMIDVRSKLCGKKGCKLHPNFGLPGEPASHCREHACEHPGMEPVGPQCIYKNCTTRPYFNYRGETISLYCSQHKEEGMWDIRARRCSHEGCETQANFGIKGNTDNMYCFLHQLPGMSNIMAKKCATLYCDTGASGKYGEYCMLCYMHMFPDQPVARNYKTKEKAISDYVIEQFPQLKWIVDKKVSGGTSARRPDLLVDLGYQVVVIEIDEDQHKIYECICENKRAMEISLDLNHKPVIFIRFNPDGYTINGKKIPSCWVPNKMGILTVPQNKKTGWKLRLGALKDQIEYWTNPSNKTSKILEVVHLFYDL